MKQRLLIEGWQPATLNALMTRNYHAAGRLKRADRERVTVLARNHGLTFAQGKRRVTLTVTIAKGQRKPDVDAYWKSTLDALVQAKLLTDDNDNGVELAPVQWERSKDARIATLIELEDI